MIPLLQRLARRVLHEESGQSLIVMFLFILSFLGIAAWVVDMGDVYYSYTLLRASTNAAALAAAEGLPNNSSSVDQAALNAVAYSSQAGSKNAWGNLTITNFTASAGCLTTGVGATVPCLQVAGGSRTANIIQITQTAKVRTYFAAIFGTPYVTLTATGTALIAGGPNKPYNIVLVLDTTGSMRDTDSSCGKTQLACATQGMQLFLEGMSACMSGGCGGTSNNTSNYPNALDRIALFTFPNQVTSEVGNNYDCSGADPADELGNPYSSTTISDYSTDAVPYVFPKIGASPGTTTYVYTTTVNGKQKSTTYNVTSDVTYGLGDANGFMTNYNTPTSSITLSGGGSGYSLNTGSDMVMALGGKSGCSSMAAPSIDGTYYASVIYEAQAALTAESTTGTQNVMIILGDGDMNVDSNYISQFNSMVTSASQTNGLVPSASPGASTNYYPSWNNDCGQAIWAADYAKQHGTEIFTVAYGALTTSGNNGGCHTDGSRYGKGIPLPAGGSSLNISPCEAMQDMASSANNFYSDSQGSGSCISSVHPGDTDLSGIFGSIRTQLSTVHLVPNSIFPSSGSVLP